jgi:TrkA domain protein
MRHRGLSEAAVSQLLVARLRRVNVEVTPLPGIGVRQDFQTRSGRRVGLISYRDGRAELLVYRMDDPDACSASIPLTSSEAGTLASLLGAPHLVEHIAGQYRDLTGIQTHQIAVVPGSRFDGATLGDTALRTRTGTSVVAVIRAGAVHASPRPDFGLQGGDLLVTVGTDEGLAEAARVLERG